MTNFSEVLVERMAAAHWQASSVTPRAWELLHPIKKAEACDRMRAALDASGLTDTQKQIVELTAALESEAPVERAALAIARIHSDVTGCCFPGDTCEAQSDGLPCYCLKGAAVEARAAFDASGLREAIEALKDIASGSKHRPD